VVDHHAYVVDLEARIPFHYGIASLTSVPHLLLRLEVEVEGDLHTGVAADSLPPKWFTKDPATSAGEDLAGMLASIEGACRIALEGGAAQSAFELWARTQEEQLRSAGQPPLLAGLGVSLVERAVIDALCRARRTTLAGALRGDLLGIRLGALYPELEGTPPSALLPDRPGRRITVRHTVGLADPLTGADLGAEERAGDGLPRTLDDCIREYGLTHFKIKLSGEGEADLDRLRRIATILMRSAPQGGAFSLDANEQYPSVDALRDFWDRLERDPRLGPWLGRLLFIEQPLRRDLALGPDVAEALGRWPDRPPLIIDESDDHPGRFGLALERGYVGTSHKNCKGVFRGVASACLVSARNRAAPARGGLLMTGEDLVNVGPVALTQDLAVAASIGLGHLERNGHHYFRGLSGFPASVQGAVLERHPDLYRPHPQGFPTLAIERGRLRIGTVVDAPFGHQVPIDWSQLTSLAEWRAAGSGETAGD
jgi:hypothetical protein